MKRFFIAQVGKTYGLHGDLKLHLYTDFPEQFKVGYLFQTSFGLLEILRYDRKRGTIAFKGYENIESAKKLVNTKIYSTVEETRERCYLNEGEHFWFDLEGCKLMEKGVVLGEIKEIQRLAGIDYFLVKTDYRIIKKGSPSSFLIPKIERYVTSIDIDSKVVEVVDGMELLETLSTTSS